MRKLGSKKLRPLSRVLRKGATPQEKILWSRLRNNCFGVKFRRQVVIDDIYIVDFLCVEKNLVIEIDGSQHAESKTDLERTAYLEKRGFKVLRFWNNEVNTNLQGCLEAIYACCNTPSP